MSKNNANILKWLEKKMVHLEQHLRIGELFADSRRAEDIRKL